MVLGDSITAGYGLPPEEAYPALLQERLRSGGWPHRVVNAGVSGDTTAGGARRVGWVLKGGAEVLLVALGGNDGLRGVPPAETAANLTRIITEARRLVPGLSVVVAGMQMPESMGPGFSAEFAAVFPQVARSGEAALVPFLLEGVGGDPAMNQADLIHPNAEGQRRIAEVVWPVLQEVLRARERAAQGR